MSVVNVWSGAVTDTGARVVAKVTGASQRLAIADNPGLSGPLYTAAVTPTAQGVATFDVTGLTADTQYYYAVEDDSVLDTAMVGRFHTHGTPGNPYSFTVAHATCAGGNTGYPITGALAPTRVSDHPVFDDIRALDPLMMIHGGDFDYCNFGDGLYVPDASVGTYRRAIDDVLSGRQGALYRQVPLVWMWDDHDYGPDNADSTAPGKLAAAQVYRERVPHYPLAAGDTGTDAIYHSFTIGRTLVVVSDIRYYRDPASVAAPRTMMGAAQLAWLDNLLATSTAEFLIWVQGQDFRVPAGTSTASWAGFDDERTQLVTMFGDHGWLNRMCMLTGDSHAMAIDTGSTTPGGIPTFMFSPLDSALTPGPTYDLGRRGSTTGGSRGQWGTLQITDAGSFIRVTGTGRWWSG